MGDNVFSKKNNYSNVILKKKKIVFVKNVYPFEKDPRLIKLINMLKDYSHSILFIGWNKKNINKTNNFNDLRIKSMILNFKCFENGFITLFFIPIWWIFLFQKLISLDWDIIHVINFSSNFPLIFSS